MIIILSLLLVTLSICLLFFMDSFNDRTLLIYVSSISCVIFTVIDLFYGAIVPNRDIYLSSKYRKVGDILYILSTLLTNSAVSPSSVRVFEGNVPIRRSWSPVTTLIPIVIIGPLMSICFLLDNPPPKFLVIAWFFTILLLIIFKTLWAKEFYNEQSPGSGWKKIAKIYGIFFAVLFIIGIGAHFIKPENPYPSIKNVDIKQLRRYTKNAEDTLQHLENNDFNKKTDIEDTKFENLEPVLEEIRKNYLEQKTYYCVKEIDAQNTSILVWTDSSENVTIYMLEKNSNSYILQSTFLSEELTKQDMIGKETGVWEP